MPITVTPETLHGSLDFLKKQEGQEFFLQLIKWLMRTEEGSAIVASIFLEVGARLNGVTDEGTEPIFTFIDEAVQSGDPRISMVILNLALFVRSGAQISQAQGSLTEMIVQLQQMLPTEPVVDDMLLAAKNLRKL